MGLVVVRSVGSHQLNLIAVGRERWMKVRVTPVRPLLRAKAQSTALTLRLVKKVGQADIIGEHRRAQYL